jgi:hypothetical protein
MPFAVALDLWPEVSVGLLRVFLLREPLHIAGWSAPPLRRGMMWSTWESLHPGGFG